MNSLPKIYNAGELSAAYAAYSQQGYAGGLDLSKWLPSFRHDCRPLMPGELCFIMAEPGVGKSMVLQQLAIAYDDPSLFFEMELPRVLMYERFQQQAASMTGEQVFKHYESGKTLKVEPLKNVRVVDATRLNRDQMLALIDVWRKEDDDWEFPGPGVNVEDGGLIVVDYIGLMASAGKSRYERVSIAAEDLKTLAKEANVIVLAATQMHRKEGSGSNYEPGLHDAKDSSSIEDAADMFLGMWRDADDKNTGYVKIVKNRKGISGRVVKCVVEGQYMRWREQMPTASDYGVESDI